MPPTVAYNWHSDQRYSKCMLRSLQTAWLLYICATCVADVHADTYPELEYVQSTERLDWQTVNDKKNIHTSLAQLDGQPIKLIRHQSTLTLSTETALQNIIDLFGDGTNCPQWMGLCKSSMVLEEHANGSKTIHSVINMPWPFSNRDAVSLKTVFRSDNEVRVELKATPEAAPETSLVRMVSESRMLLRYVEEESHHELQWEIYSDPRGSLPVGTVNKRAHKESRRDFINLMTALKALSAPTSVPQSQ